MPHPYQPPAETDDHRTTEPWWLFSDRMAMIFAFSVVLAIFAACVDWAAIWQ